MLTQLSGRHTATKQLSLRMLRWRQEWKRPRKYLNLNLRKKHQKLRKHNKWQRKPPSLLHWLQLIKLVLKYSLIKSRYQLLMQKLLLRLTLIRKSIYKLKTKRFKMWSKLNKLNKLLRQRLLLPQMKEVIKQEIRMLEIRNKYSKFSQ